MILVRAARTRVEVTACEDPGQRRQHAQQAQEPSAKPSPALVALLGRSRATLLTSLAVAGQRDAWPAVQQLLSPFQSPLPPPPLTDTVPPSSLMDADSSTARLLGIEVHYKLRSSSSLHVEQTTLVLCFHGFNGSTVSYDTVLQGFADAVHGSALAFDRPPFGLTQRAGIAERLFTTSGAAELAAELVNHVGRVGGSSWSRIILVGHSAGAGVALATAQLLTPGTVAGLVLVSPAVPASGEDSFLNRADLGSLVRFAITRAVLALDGPGLAFVRASTIKRAQDVRASRNIGYGGGKPAPQSVVDAYLAPLQADAWDTASLTAFRSFEVPPAPALSQLASVPVCIIQGAQDDIVPVAGVRKLVDAMRGRGVACTYVELTSAGHLPLEEDPEACVSAFTAWLPDMESVLNDETKRRDELETPKREAHMEMATAVR
jgi:pimeloyl-ACP methyl ester carboxylesterase